MHRRMNLTKGDRVSRLYRFRPGALDSIARSLNLHTERQLAACLRISADNLGALRHGGVVGAPMALHVADLMGRDHDLGPWLEPADDDTIVAA